MPHCSITPLGSKKEIIPISFDYLSVDIDGMASLLALKAVPLDHYRARVITFEHDAYHGNGETRELSRDYLDGLGYHRLCADIMNDGCAYEDWYVHPELVNMERAMALRASNKEWREILFRNSDL